MKIVLFSRYPEEYDSPHGGVESVTVILARALARIRGFEIHLITLEKKYSKEHKEQDGEVTIHRLPGSGWPQIVDILCGPGRKRLIEKIRQIAPDIVHSHETCGLTLGHLSIPHVFTVHGFDHANIPAEGRRDVGKVRSLLWKGIEKYGMGGQKDIFSISPYVRAMIEPLTRANIYDIDNPIDERFFDLNKTKEHGRVLCVGWINERKNTLGSVKAFARALAHGCSGTLAIAGQASEPAYMEKVKAEIQQSGIENNVEFLGHISHARLSEELARASVFMLPSLQENAPMAISEAMAASVPVIASNCCGMPYMVAEGKSGYLIDPLDTKQIAEKMAHLLTDSKLCGQFGTKGHEIALQRFHPDVVADKTKKVYEHILNRSA